MQKLYGAKWIPGNSRLSFRKVLVREISKARFCAVERGVLWIIWGITTIQIYLVVFACLALSGGGSRTAAALTSTRYTFTSLRICKIIIAAFQSALLVLVVAVTFLTDILMKAVTIALFAEWVTGATDCFSSQGFQFPLTLWSNPLVEISFGAGFGLMEALDHFKFFVYYCLVAAVATKGTDIIRRAFASADTIPVAVLAFTVGVIVLGVWTLVHTKRTIFDMLALMAVARSVASTSQFTFFVTFHALAVPWGLKESFPRIT